MIIGIDLGTTNTCAAVLSGNQPGILSNAASSRSIPSVVAFTDGELLVGEAAAKQSVTNPTRTISASKRLIGRCLNEPFVKEHQERHSYKIVGSANGDAWIEANGESYSPCLISAAILKAVKETAEDQYGEAIERAVIAVPSYFNGVQRQAVRDSGQIVGLTDTMVVSDSVAAALAYGQKKNIAETVGIFDLGGGSLDFSILEIEDGLFEVKSVNGNTALGGEDFDARIVGYLIEKFKEDFGIDLATDKVAKTRLKQAAEQAKIDLSSAKQTEINLPFISMDSSSGQPLDLVMTLTRAWLESLVGDLIAASLKPCQLALKDAGLAISDIDKIVLVGGMTRMPRVVEEVSLFFGQEPFKGVNPDEMVAMGAAIQAGILQGNVKDVVLLDVTPLSLGIETLGGVFTRLIDRNTMIPTTKSQAFSTAEDNQSAVTIRVFQGEREMAADNTLLGQFNLEDILPAARGTPKIKVSFDIDATGDVSAIAKDENTGKAQRVTIQRAGTLSEEEIERMSEALVRGFGSDRAHASSLEENVLVEESNLRKHGAASKRKRVIVPKHSRKRVVVPKASGKRVVVPKSGSLQNRSGSSNINPSGDDLTNENEPSFEKARSESQNKSPKCCAREQEQEQKESHAKGSPEGAADQTSQGKWSAGKPSETPFADALRVLREELSGGPNG